MPAFILFKACESGLNLPLGFELYTKHNWYRWDLH